MMTNTTTPTRSTQTWCSETLKELTTEYGSPLYVYDADRLRANITAFRNAFSGWPMMRIHYAVKALSNLSILQIMHENGVGLDCVSIGEIQRGLAVGYRPEEMLFTPNGVHRNEFSQAAELGVVLNIDSLPLLRWWAESPMCTERKICLRINPHIVGGGNKNIQVGGIDSKFGISIFMLPEAIKLCQEKNIAVHGLHVHTGSDILDIDVFLRSAEILFDAAKNFSNLEFIDFGSGFKVPYKQDEPATDMPELGRRLCERFSLFCKDYGKDLLMCFEPGKFLVSDAGALLVEVTQVKESPAGTFAMTNSGFHQLIRPMLYGSYHHIENISSLSKKTRVYTVVGNLCETDTFAESRELREISRGDILAFYNAGAYGFSMASQFNSRPRPAEILLEGESHRVIRKAEQPEDIWALEKACLR